MSAFQPWLDDPSGANVPLDQIFNLLHQEYGKDEVNALVTERLSAPPKADEIGREHRLIKRISSNQSGAPQIVTTNFDLLFEAGTPAEEITYHVPPAFPDLAFGTTIEGITYLHGRLTDANSVHHPYVLSSADFGRAYLSEGWATNFIRNLLNRYTVVLVGYQAEDPPIKYLLQGLNHDGLFDRSRLYAFDRGVPEDVEAKWLDRGVTAIAYTDHSHLWRTMEAWADRADNPRQWRASVIAASRQDPKEKAPHQRGQLAHVLRSVQGTRLLSECEPPCHPEWICVMDANVRSAKQSSDYGEDAEKFDPRDAYGLDDDLEIISEEDRRQGVSNDNLLIWRGGDDNPHEFHRLGGRPADGFEAIPPRLGHLITWISRSIESPVLAWWAIRQIGLHPRLLQQIEWRIRGSSNLHQRARHIWNLILEHHSDPRNRGWDGDWFDLKKRIAGEGWTASVLRDFRHISAPRVAIRPPLGLGGSKPPTGTWDDIRLGDLAQFEIKLFERHNDEMKVPDEALLHVFRISEDQFTAASGLLTDVETTYFPTPTYYPDREVDGKDHGEKAAEALTLFVRLFDRIAALEPGLANAHATIWPQTDRFFYRKLKLYAFANENVFKAGHVAEALLSFDQETFWDLNVVRELLFLIVDRWAEFANDQRRQLTERILRGPNQRPHWSDEDYPRIRDEFAARYGRYLELQSCVLSADHEARLAGLIEGIPQWSDGWANSLVTKRGARVGWVGTDETPEAILDIPVNEIVPRAKNDLKRDFGSFTEKRPFTGLVKAKSRKALSALTVAGKAGEYPQAFWSSIIEDLPEDIPTRLRRVFLNRLARLPQSVIVELRHSLGRWLEKKLVAMLQFDERLSWLVYDRIVDGILSGGADAAESGLGEVRQGDEIVESSRRTLAHAINAPVGMCTEALLHAVPGKTQQAGSLVPEHIKCRLERLFAAPGEGSDHAVSVVMRSLDWLMYVDPIWTQDRLLPMLAFDHPSAEPAWNGFLYSGQVPSQPLTEVIKSRLLNLLPWIDGFSWDRDLSHVAAQWLGFMRVFRPDQSYGLTKREMRTVLRYMRDEARNRFISWLGQVGQTNDNGWTELVIPFINEVWPRERRFRTSASMRAWIGLLDDTDDKFPAVYGAVKKFLVPVETNDHPFYRFTREINDEQPITARFPEATLDLMDITTPQVITRPAYELPKVLAIIAETDPTLTSDPRYLRLINLIERT
ncbi:SIR2 family protein [Mesorhizobium sp.]|uniref:SIR2 family protein n=1 Tax=Mesorhizobium sp. TaxID=1871066 RepID=UPI0025C32380|nr:SIR2 family protein [Mesorhizobium sp.]